MLPGKHKVKETP